MNPKKKEENFDNERKHYVRGRDRWRGKGHWPSNTTSPIMEKEKAQPKDEAEAIQDRGMINPKYNAIIIKSLGIMLQNIQL